MMMTTHGSPTDGGGARGPGRPATAHGTFVTTRTTVALVLLVLVPVCAALATTLITGLLPEHRRR